MLKLMNAVESIWTPNTCVRLQYVIMFFGEANIRFRTLIWRCGNGIRLKLPNGSNDISANSIPPRKPKAKAPIFGGLWCVFGVMNWVYPNTISENGPIWHSVTPDIVRISYSVGEAMPSKIKGSFSRERAWQRKSERISTATMSARNTECTDLT